MRRRDHNEIVQNLRERTHFLERQNEELLNRLMHLTERPWTPAPIDMPVYPDAPEEEEFDHERFLTSVESLPEE